MGSAAALFMRARTRGQAVYAWLREDLWGIAEWILLLGVWYAMFGRQWDALHIPLGGEYARSMSPFFFWDSLKTCVACSFWAPHGGGKPMLADPFGSFLHPVSMLTSIVFGAVAGASYTQSIAFLLMGMSALWFGHLIRLQRFIRVWFAIAAMIGGHMVARIEIGSIGLPLSFASACLAFVTVYWYTLAPSLRRSIIVGLCVGALFTAGQMYYQYFFCLVLAIWIAVALKSGYHQRNSSFGTHAAVAASIAVLMAAPLVVNLVFTAGIYGKLTDPEMKFALPISSQLINMLIPTNAVAKTATLNPFPYPYAYATYIGMLPCLAGLMWYARVSDALHRRVARAVLFGGALAAVLGTGVFSKLAMTLNNEAVNYIASAFRFIVLYNGFVALAILLLAALGAHAFVNSSMQEHAMIDRAFVWVRDTFRIDARHGVIVLLGIYNLLGLQSYASPYIGKVLVHDPKTVRMERAISTLTDGYIDIPNWLLLSVMQHEGMASTYFSSVTMEGRKFPPPQYLLTQKVPDTIPTTILESFEGDWFLVRNDAPREQFAYLETDTGTVEPCSAQPHGGMIDIRCENTSGGTLTTLVNAIPGWESAVDTAAYTYASEGVWLTATIPAGTHTVSFRYAPWYAWFGVALIPIPWVLALVLWMFSGEEKRTVVAQLPA